MSVFVTGSSGFVGREVCRQLRTEGIHCLGLSRSGKGIDQVRVDLASGEGLESLPWGRCTGVIHLAAGGVKAQQRNWGTCVESNILATQNLLMILEKKAADVPFLSASTYYEDLLDRVPAFLSNPYILTKRVSTELVRDWGTQFQRRVAVARIFQVYGPDDDPGNVLNYVKAGLKNQTPVRLGSGNALKDWIYIIDAGACVVKIFKGIKTGWHQFDVGSGSLVSIRAMVEMLLDVSGADANLITFDPSKDRADVGVAVKAEQMSWAQPLNHLVRERMFEFWNS